LTNRGISDTGRDSGASGFCSPPFQAERWIQGVTVPLECFRVELVVHQQPAGDRYCFAIEVSDPHSRELLAKCVDPSHRFGQAVGMVSHVTLDLRAILLELTDPDPF
jgi:hypothetical protein